MRSLLKITGTQFLHNIRNLRFAISVVLCVITCMLPTISYYEKSDYKRASVLSLFFTGGFEKIAENMPEFSSPAIISGFLNADWFPMLFMAVCAFPAVSLFADEYYGGMFYFSLPGSSVNRYSAAKFIAAGLTGASVFVTGFTVYAVLILLRFPNACEYPPEMLELYPTDVKYFALLALHTTVVAMLCASVMMMLAVFVRDRYFLFGLPMLAVFALNRTWIYIGIRCPQIYDEKNGWWTMLDPSCYPNFYSNFQWYTGFPYGCFLLFALAELLLFYVIFRKQIERRVRKNA